MQAIRNDIERRVKELEGYYYKDPYRIATINLLEEIALFIDQYQKWAAENYKSIQWNHDQGNIATSKERYEIWRTQKMVLTRLQDRYRKTLEILTNTK